MPIIFAMKVFLVYILIGVVGVTDSWVNRGTNDIPNTNAWG